MSPTGMLRFGVCLIAASITEGSFAMGGGPTPPSASPYAILEPQTVPPQNINDGSFFAERKSSEPSARTKSILRRIH
jgi:hypothetical protein